MTAPIIRIATPDDAAQIRDIYAPFCGNSPVSFELEPPSVDEMRRRIVEILSRFPWLVCERDGVILGYVYARSFRDRPAYQWSTEVTAYIRDGQRRSGLGRALYTSLLALLKLQGYAMVYAGITLPNPASVGLHEAIGFRPAGVFTAAGYKCDSWHDVGFWQLELQPRSAKPVPPRTFGAIQASPDWDAALSAGVSLLRKLS